MPTFQDPILQRHPIPAPMNELTSLFSHLPRGSSLLSSAFPLSPLPCNAHYTQLDHLYCTVQVGARLLAYICEMARNCCHFVYTYNFR